MAKNIKAVRAVVGNGGKFTDIVKIANAEELAEALGGSGTPGSGDLPSGGTVTSILTGGKANAKWSPPADVLATLSIVFPVNSVNGKTGIIVIGLSDLPDVLAAIQAKADAAATLTALAGKADIASLDDYLSLHGGLMLGDLGMVDNKITFGDTFGANDIRLDFLYSRPGVYSLGLDADTMNIRSAGYFQFLAGSTLATQQVIATLDSSGLTIGGKKVVGMAFVADAPSDGKQYARINGGWLELSASGTSGVVSVNGKDGVVLLTLDDLADVKAALDAKADVDALQGVAYALDSKASLNSPALYGKPTVNGAEFGAMAYVDDVPEVGKSYVRTKGGWIEAPQNGFPVGWIALLPFEVSELPARWYYPSGDYYELTSPVGQALSGLSSWYQGRWGIVRTGGTIRLFDPAKFFAIDGAGYTVGRFPRCVDGFDTFPGDVQDDAMQNLTGNFSPQSNIGAVNVQSGFDGIATGVFKRGTTSMSNAVGYQTKTAYNLLFDASLQVRTGNENRPFSVGMTPAVYLGV